MTVDINTENRAFTRETCEAHPSRGAVLLVLHAFVPKTLAGTEIYVWRLARVLARRRPIKVLHTIRAPDRPQYALEEDLLDGLPIARVVQNYPYRRLEAHLRDPALERLFQRQLEAFNPAVVHFHHLAGWPLSLPRMAWAFGADVFVTLHDYQLACPAGGQLFAYSPTELCQEPIAARCGPCHRRYGAEVGGLEAVALTLARLSPVSPDLPFRVFQRLPTGIKAAIKRVNPPPAVDTGDSTAAAARRWQAILELHQSVTGFIAPSEDLARRFERWGFDPERVHHLPNPGPRLGAVESSADAAAEELPSWPLELLFVGTLAPHKGLAEVVAAMAGFSSSQVRLTVCGDPGGFPRYVAPLMAAAGPGITFTGRQTPAEVAARLRRSHALVLGSLWPENAPLTVLEALEAGRPVIAPAIGGLPEQVHHERNGLLYAPGDVRALARAIQRLCDPSFRETLAHGVQRPWSVSEHARELEALLDHIPSLLGSIRGTVLEAAGMGRADPIDEEVGVGGDPPRGACGIGTGPGDEEVGVGGDPPRGTFGTDAGSAEVLRATVIIPVFNGGDRFRRVVARVLAQETPWPFELLILNSSSTDGALEGLEAPNLVRVDIPHAAFDHGGTRNLGARLARGAILVFLVADALPMGCGWLRTLVDGLTGCPEAAGGHARQVARADADEALRRRIAAWTPPGDGPELRRLAEGGLFEALEPRERVRLAGFDNVCSVVRREELLARPFARGPFGEDLKWGRDRLLEGRGLLYVPEAMVEHSHCRSFGAHLARARLEHRMLAAEFGVETVTDLGGWLQAMALTGARHLMDGRGGFWREMGEITGQYMAGRGG